MALSPGPPIGEDYRWVLRVVDKGAREFEKAVAIVCITGIVALTGH